MAHDDSHDQRLLDRLRPHGQEHVLRFWAELTNSERTQLAAQIEALDLPLVERLFRHRDASDDYAALAARAEPPPAFRLNDRSPAISREAARRRGEEALAAGVVGAILVAGGQGTRLGFEHPKGMFPIGPVSDHSLFQILFEKLLAVSQRYGKRVPLYIMTSAATHEETVRYLAEHDYFGLPPQDVRLFEQGNLPAVDATTGKLLLETRSSLALSPDGHGGMLAALSTSGALDDMRLRGVEQLFYFQVDNPLVVMCDPLFLGYHLMSESELSTQAVAKTGPLDRVGNVVAIDGQVRIIEYSDLPDEFAKATNADGSLKLWAGNIAVHVFDRQFLARMADVPDSLPYHVARKTVAAIDESGEVATPRDTEKNAIKFERFIFDLLPSARRSIVMEVDGAETFAPVKNADGEAKDTPSTVKSQMSALYRRWLVAAGWSVPERIPVEIRPTLALDAAEFAERSGEPRSISDPTFLQ
jgi:UDP-N-acetylglucosamine/UDP-N-acetylgalactosamine diphosphorylase